MDPARLISTSEAIDPVFVFIFGACLLLLLGITVTMAIFVLRYHRCRSPQPTSQVDSNVWLELVWTVLPSVLVLSMFWYGWKEYLVLRTVPKDAMPVTAIARMWSWSFSYANGKISSKLYVPVGKPVKVNLVSNDVIHGFFLPDFRVKRDVVPGMPNYAWFVALKPGSYDLLCSSYCGVGHSGMTTVVEALPETEFVAWLNNAEEDTSRAGKILLKKYGCLGCHSLDGTVKVGPSFKGIWGKKDAVVSNGIERIITVDESYLRRSIIKPNIDVVKGFPPVMPPFALKDDEMFKIVEYLKTIK